MDSDVGILLDRVQECFGVRFRPGELEDESYLSDLYTAVISHLAQAQSDQCFTSVAFWRLRRGCIDLFGASKVDVRPYTPTDDILPRSGRRKAWHRLATSTGLRLPGLEYSRAFVHVIFFGSALVPIGLLVGFGYSWSIGLASLLLWPFSSGLVFWTLRPFASQLSARCMTMGELAKAVVGLNYGSLTQQLGGISREKDLHEAIRNAIADLIDIDPEILKRENPRLLDLAVANDGFRAEV
jgi:hypothetical protein